MRALRIVLLVTVLAGLAAVVWLGWTGLQAAQELRAASVATDRLNLAVREARFDDARDELADVRREARAAADHVSGPIWAATTILPVVGDDVTAVRQASDLVADAAEGVGTDLVDVAGELDPADLLPSGGRIDLAPLERVAPRLGGAADDLDALAVRAEDLDLTGVRPLVADPLAQLQEEVVRIRDLTVEAATAARLLPSMLGSDGARRYLLLVQNNAELRATGGIPGAYAEIRAREGRIRLGEQGSARGLGSYEEPVLPISGDEDELFSPLLGLYAQNVNLTPRFPRTGELAAAMWADSHPTEVDGVASVDPVALSYLLRATGPVTVQLPSGESVQLTADNVVPYLLNQVYLDNPDDPARQDVVFATAAGAVFDAVTGGGADPRTVLRALTQGVQERRLLLWSRQDEEQTQIARAPIAGDLDGSQEQKPYVGVYFNNQSGSKLDYYLDTEVATTSRRCVDAQGGRAQEIELALTVRSSVPEDARSLGRYILGLSRPAGFSVSNLVVYFPQGSRLRPGTTTTRVAADGAESSNPTASNLAADGDFPVEKLSLGLDPGETATVTWTFLTRPGLTGPVDLQVTPQVRPVTVDLGAPAC